MISIILLLANTALNAQKVVCGADRTEAYLPLIEGKRIGVVANQTSAIGKTHLIDSLLSLKVNVVKIFAPEHGFRGDKEAGAHIKTQKDARTGLNVISLYGKKKKPNQEDMQGIDVLLFDIQDVGCRFFTYISTLHYCMEACAENNLPLVLLDRPNPNNGTAKGTILTDTSLVSFVGLHPIPMVYDLTIGELALMINGMGWLGTDSRRVCGQTSSLRCDIKVIPLLNYTNTTHYDLPIAPSPNLQTPNAVSFYPNLCLFEGTKVSVGRGTDLPFEIVGFPSFKADKATIEFVPRAIKGVSDHPMYENKLCKGLKITPQLSQWLGGFIPEIVKTMYEAYEPKDEFFNSFFDRLAGTKQMRKVIEGKLAFKDAEPKWTQELNDYLLHCRPYRLYPYSEQK